MLKKYTRAVAVAALLVPAVTRAQPSTSPSVPALPDAGAAAGAFSAIAGQYQYGGCVDAAGATIPAGAPVAAAYCVRGLLLVGTRADAALPAGSLGAYLAEAVSYDARLGGVYSENLDTQRAWGTVTDAGCPVGCAGAFAFSMLAGAPSPLFAWYSDDVLAPGARFEPAAMQLAIGYNRPGPTGGYGTDYPTFALTAVPEPATLALTLGGLAVLGGVVARRRGTV